MNRSLAAVAAANGGPFRLQEALAAGYTEAVVASRVASGSWLRLRQGIYVESARLDSGCAYTVRAAAALLTLNKPGAACSHEWAAAILGIDLCIPPPDEVTLTRPPGREGTTRPVGVRRHRAAVPPSHLVRVRGVPVTSPARTVVDLARRGPVAAATVAADSALHQGLTDHAKLRAVLTDCSRWPGIARAATVVRVADGRARSPLETLGRLMCLEYGLPEPEVSAYIGDEDGIFTEADLYWQDVRVIVLLDGLMKYSEPETLRNEKLTQERLERGGFIVVRLTWADVTRRPDWSVDRIRVAFAAAHTRRAQRAG